MMNRAFRLLPCLLFFGALSARADFGLGIEPVVGYENVQKFAPPPTRTVNRMIYGARLTLGLPLIALELEGTQGKDTEEIPASSLVVKDTTNKVKLGLRAGLSLSSLVRLFARGGVQGSQNIHEETTGGVTTKSTEKLKYYPYAGVGLRAGLSSKIAFTADIVAIFKKFPDMKQNDYQTTAGLSIKLP